MTPTCTHNVPASSARPARAGRPFLWAAVLLIGLAGCEDASLDPFENDAKYFTVYGYLDVLETTHALRVIPITRRSAVIQTPSDPAADLDVQVTTTNLRTGEVVHWVHNLEELADGTYGHIYRAVFRVEQEHSYRLEILRNDGALTTAETTVPYIPDAALFERGPVIFNADSTQLTQRIRMPDVASPWAMEGIYLWGGGDINHRVYAPYGRRGVRTAGGDWEFELTISEDQRYVRENIQGLIDIGRIAPGTLGTLTAMGLRLRILDDQWDPPEGIFDPEVLSLPSGVTNVVNGYGFFGSIGLYRQEWNTCELSGVLGYSYAPADC
ncbi:MAG: hypothetical protein R2834_02355 [Rhodothermales bacterium]